MKKIAIALMLIGGIATAGQAEAQGWHGGGGGGYAGAAIVGGLAGLLVGSAAVAASRPAPVYAQPVYAQPVYSAPPAYCYDAYGRAYACAPAPVYYGPPPPPRW